MATHSLTLLPPRDGEPAPLPLRSGLPWDCCDQQSALEVLCATPRPTYQEDSRFLKPMSNHIKIPNITYRDLGPHREGPSWAQLSRWPCQGAMCVMNCLGHSRPGQPPAKHCQVTSTRHTFLRHRIVRFNNNALLFKALSLGVDVM